MSLCSPKTTPTANWSLGSSLEFNIPRQIQPLETAGGLTKVLDRFKSNEVGGMERYPGRLMVLLIDFDGKDNRLGVAKAVIPEHLADRVFVLAAWTEPEDLKSASLGSYEAIGRAMAQDCRQNTDTVWGHELLRHNAGELARLCERIQPILST